MFNMPSVQGVIAATATSASTKIGKKHCILVNTGAKTVYIRLNDTAALATDPPIYAGGSVTLDSSEGCKIYSVQTICGGADVTNVSYLAWN